MNSNEVSTDVRSLENTSLDKILTMWNDKAQLQKIKQMFAPNATELEFETFVGMGKACGLNPFLREIWMVKYDLKEPAQIFIGRDGYRKIISRNPNYDGHVVDAVFSNDEFKVDLIKGEVIHLYNFKNRGTLIGAYCLVYMKNVARPYYNFVELSEYDLKRSLWNSKKATMIKKVAECQTIKMADQTCSGTYSEDEVPENMLQDAKDSKAKKLNQEMKLSRKVIEGETIDQETGEVKEILEDVKPIDINAPTFTFEEIKQKMESSINKDQLTEAASVVSESNLTSEQKSELSKIYREKLKAIKEKE